jgi:hypothetical protein
MMLGLIGDLEGERAAAVDALRLLGERGDVAVACQLGDLRFGYGPDPEGYLDAIESVCAEYEIELLCITGNHENWALLDALWADPAWQDEDGTLGRSRCAATSRCCPEVSVGSWAAARSLLWAVRRQ